VGPDRSAQRDLRLPADYLFGTMRSGDAGIVRLTSPSVQRLKIHPHFIPMFGYDTTVTDGH
jgi:hypothetical protein